MLPEICWNSLSSLPALDHVDADRACLEAETAASIRALVAPSAAPAAYGRSGNEDDAVALDRVSVNPLRRERVMHAFDHLVDVHRFLLPGTRVWLPAPRRRASKGRASREHARRSGAMQGRATR